ncbi:YgaP family membrane protein [Spiribacter pallidus]|jgi:hypothetical protein|uniref:DUF2892 domain-containing protein n=1 Tax=Spiribacter pallidus TaxID=1987936 RepID=A0ABV3TE17_9GAMM
MLKTNVGAVDRVIRAAVGLVLIALAVFGQGMTWGWVGVIPLATALVSYCPAYSLLGMNTCGRKA